MATVCAFKLDKFRGFSVKRALHPLCRTMTETEWEMTVKVLASGDARQDILVLPTPHLQVGRICFHFITGPTHIDYSSIRTISQVHL